MRKLRKAPKLLDTAFPSPAKRVYAVTALVVLAGCLCPGLPTPDNYDTVNCTNETYPLEAQLAQQQAELQRLNMSLLETQQNLTDSKNRLEAANQMIQSLQNASKDCTNYTRYDFSCADVVSSYDFQTSYRCYWDIRQKYATGAYTSMADLCISLGLPDACECYWSMPEFTGARISTGLGIERCCYPETCPQSVNNPDDCICEYAVYCGTER